MWSNTIRNVAARGTATNMPRIPAQLNPAIRATMTSSGGVRNDRCDARDQAERDGVGQPEHRAADAAEDTDHAGDDDLAPHVCVKHPPDATPDLVEVVAVVVGHQAAQYAPHRMRVQRQQMLTALPNWPKR